MDPTQALRRKRILIVEDEPGYQELLETLLGGSFDPVVCSSVEEALAKIDMEPFDLIIADINLQGMTGFQILAKMKSLNRLDVCPVVMCSSQVDLMTKEMASEMGAAGFIPKPYEFEMVLSTVKALLGAS